MHFFPQMKAKMITFPRLNLPLVAVLLVLGAAGCATTSKLDPMQPQGNETNPGEQTVARLHVNDTITIKFSGLPEDMLPQEKLIKEDGTISLPDIGSVPAAGKTPGELEDAIRNLYVPAIYKRLTVTVQTTGDRVFFVRGEVKAPNRVIYVGQITVTKAITAAGDFTDFANRKKVWLIRANGQRFKLNVNKILDGEAPDPSVYPGDQIVVDRRLF